MRAIEAVMRLETAPCDLSPKTLDPDTVLVERLRHQEEGAAEALVAAYGDRVYRLAVRITDNASDAEEVVQDALSRARRSARRCGSSSPRSSRACTEPASSCGPAWRNT
jgi:Sigma-70 region 2